MLLVLLVLATVAVVIFLLLGRVTRLFSFGCKSVVVIDPTNKIIFVSRVDDCVAKKYLAKGWKPIEVGGAALLQERSRDNP
jgi:hypothetical protein